MFRKIIIAVYLILLLSILLTSVTHLEFSHLWERLTVAMLFGILSPFIFIWLAKYSIILKVVSAVIYITIIIIFPFTIIDGEFTSKWETVGIHYRLKANPNTYVGIQMQACWINDCRRTVKVRPVTPLFNWVTEVEEERFAVDKNWKKVNEEYNPFGWIFP